VSVSSLKHAPCYTRNKSRSAFAGLLQITHDVPAIDGFYQRESEAPRPYLPAGRHRTGLPGNEEFIIGSALTPLRESVTALPSLQQEGLPTACLPVGRVGRRGIQRLARDNFLVCSPSNPT